MSKIKRLISVSDMICDALLSLIEKGRPYAEISIQDIVDEAGVCRSSFYRNYKSKDDIFQKRFREICEGKARSSKEGTAKAGAAKEGTAKARSSKGTAVPKDPPYPSPHLDFFEIFRAACFEFSQHRRFFRCYYTADARSYFDTITRHVIATNAPVPGASVPPEDYYTYACRAWIGIGVITEWFLRDCDIPVDELVEIVKRHKL